MDAISLQRIDTCHPDVRDNLRGILGECDRALTGRAKVRITEANRTFTYQDELYALGRTVVNPNGKSKNRPMGYKVTNAKGGYSIHNFGLAVDFCLIIGGKEASWDDVKDWDGDGVSDWMEVVAVFEKHGWTWGGRWSSFVDKPHFEKTFGYALNELRTKRVSKDFIPGTTYVSLGRKRVQSKETTANVNLRRGPGTEYIIDALLPRRTELVVSQVRGDWSEVAPVGFSIKGWVSNKYIK